MMPGRRRSDDLVGFLMALGCIALIGAMAWGAVGAILYAIYTIARGA